MGKIRLREMNGLWIDAILRMVFFAIFVVLERYPSFVRVIQPEEMWMYKYPLTESYFPVTILWPLVLIAPTLLIGFFYWQNRDAQDTLHAVLAITLGLSLNGVVTDVIKVIVGRPRPDFFYRCFPDGLTTPDMTCTGPEALVIDGRKSFPSGHSSFSFAGLSFVSLYLAGKLRVFSRRDSGAAWRLCAVLAPLMLATCIALSRTCDYHHHWQDVMVGSMLGLAISTLSYRLYFPSLGSAMSHRPSSLGSSDLLVGNSSQPPVIYGGSSESIETPTEVKWI